MLRHFGYVEIIAEQRKHIRLELAPPINALFNSSTGIVRGKLIELSMGGAVMSVVQAFGEVIGEETNLSLMLPDINQNTIYNIKIPAKLVHVSDDTYPRRYQFVLFAEDRISDREIAKFLHHRQVDIIRELKEASELAPLNVSEDVAHA